jgi:TRAP-type C4-dicarboxylate transport system permease small subunit
MELPMRTIGRLISSINGTATIFCGAIVMLLVLHVTAEVVMRYVFGMPLKGTIQFVALYYMTAITFLPLGAVEERDSHVVVEVITNLLPRALVTIFSGVGLVLTAAVSIILAARAWEEAMAQYEIGYFVMEGGFRLDTWPSYFFVSIGFGLMLVVSVWKLICLLTGRDSGLTLSTFDPGAPVLKDK